jgi:hypothetical protein
VFLLPGRVGHFGIPGHQFIQKGDEPIIDGAIGKIASIIAIGGPDTDLKFIILVVSGAARVLSRQELPSRQNVPSRPAFALARCGGASKECPPVELARLTAVAASPAD